MINVETLELSKENIQPLKQGRKAGQLGLALQAQTNSEIQQQILKERYNYELLIRMYEGDDPLQPRYDYVAWIEQTFPKHGPETNLIPLLEDTIATYKDDPRYTNDERFIKLIIKYIETQLNRLEIYQLVYGQGIGTKCAYFYKAWAEELDLEQDYKRANNVFQLGLANGAQPKELLEQAQMLFQLSVGRKMLSGGCLEEGAIDESDGCRPSASGVPTAPSRRINNGLLEETSERCVLGKLKKNVGSVRPAQGPAGTLAQSRTLQPPKSNASQPVYQDSENSFSSVDALVCVPRVGEPSSTTPFQKSEATHKENMMKAGTWNKGYNKKHHHTPHVTVPHTPSTPSFRIHLDDEEVLGETPVRPVSDCPSALKTKRMDNFNCPMAVFEPPDPTVKPMYPKQKVYAGGREFQLEEIKAAYYNKEFYRKKREEELRAMGLPVSCLDTPEVLISTPQIARRQCTTEAYQVMTPIYTEKASDSTSTRVDRSDSLNSDIAKPRERRLKPLPLLLETPEKSGDTTPDPRRHRVCGQLKPLPLLLETPEKPEDRIVVEEMSYQTPLGGRIFESTAKDPTPDSGIEDCLEPTTQNKPSVFHEGFVKSSGNIFMTPQHSELPAEGPSKEVPDGEESKGRKFNVYCEDSPLKQESLESTTNKVPKQSTNTKFMVFVDDHGQSTDPAEGPCESELTGGNGMKFDTLCYESLVQKTDECCIQQPSVNKMVGKQFTIFEEDTEENGEKCKEIIEPSVVRAFTIFSDDGESHVSSNKYKEGFNGEKFCDDPTSSKSFTIYSDEEHLPRNDQSNTACKVDKFNRADSNKIDEEMKISSDKIFTRCDKSNSLQKVSSGKISVFCDDPEDIITEKTKAKGTKGSSKTKSFEIFTDDAGVSNNGKPPIKQGAKDSCSISTGMSRQTASKPAPSGDDIPISRRKSMFPGKRKTTGFSIYTD